MAVASDRMVPSCVEPGVSTPQTACISGKSIPKFFRKQIPGCWGGHHHPSNENGLPSQPCWVPGVCDLPGNEGLQMAHAAVPPQAGWWERGCLKVGTHPKSWFWLVKWSNTILYTCIFFTVHLKQDYEGNRSLPCFPRCFLVPNTTTRRWYRLLFSQDLVNKLRETAKA